MNDGSALRLLRRGAWLGAPARPRCRTPSFAEPPKPPLKPLDVFDLQWVERSANLARRPQHRLRAHELRHQDRSAARGHLAGRQRRQTCAPPVRAPHTSIAPRWSPDGTRSPTLGRPQDGSHSAIHVLDRERRHRRHQQFHRVARRARLVARRPLARRSPCRCPPNASP